MAGSKFAFNSGAVSLAASANIVPLAVKAPATVGIVLTAIEVSFEGGGAATEKAVTVEYVTWTTDGTGSASVTVAKADRQDDNTPATTAQKNYTSSPPTGSESIIRSEYVDANKGNDSFPGAIRLKAGEVFGVRLIAPSGLTTTNVRVFIGGDE
jgi:hypothetical protein